MAHTLFDALMANQYFSPELQKMTNTISKFAIIVSVFALLSACATTTPRDPSDPFESYNRKAYAFNTQVDRVVVTPTVKVYNTVIPYPIRTGINNFFLNLFQLPTIANDLLQAELKLAAKDVGRFAVNSTLGIAGFFDVATPMGLEYTYQDFGITLARWGDRNSPYLVIPFIGPSTIRDLFGVLIDYRLFTIYAYLDPAYVRYSLLGFESFNYRAQFQEASELTEQIAIDHYILQREAYLQRRNYLISLLEAPEKAEEPGLYIDDEADQLYVDEDEGDEIEQLYVEEDEGEIAPEGLGREFIA